MKKPERLNRWQLRLKRDKIQLMRKRQEKIYQYEVILDPNGQGYTVTAPKLPGLVTEGRNIREAREMAKDAIRCYLEAILKDHLLQTRNSGTVKKEKIQVSI